MADEQVLNAARELQTRSEHADGDVRHELGLMTASVAAARATARTIDETDADTRRHADGMARQLAADLRDAAAVLESSSASGRLAAEALRSQEHSRFPAVLLPASPARSFVVPPPPGHRNVEDRIKAHPLPAQSSWITLVDDPLDLAEELAHAAEDVAAIPAETRTPDKERPAAEPTRGTKETA
jgi:hypothetical protein